MSNSITPERIAKRVVRFCKANPELTDNSQSIRSVVMDEITAILGEGMLSGWLISEITSEVLTSLGRVC